MADDDVFLDCQKGQSPKTLASESDLWWPAMAIAAPELTQLFRIVALVSSHRNRGPANNSIENSNSFYLFGEPCLPLKKRNLVLQRNIWCDSGLEGVALKVEKEGQRTGVSSTWFPSGGGLDSSVTEFMLRLVHSRRVVQVTFNAHDFSAIHYLAFMKAVCF